MIRQFRQRKADHWQLRADVSRARADLLKSAHDMRVNGGGTVSLASFDAYATLIGQAEDCERKAAKWRP